MKIEFTKMHGLGNDMIIIDGRASGFVPSVEEARFLCDRRRGVGADQILVLHPSSRADFKMRIFNADGSEVEMCGNGIRCLARYLHERGIAGTNPLEIETRAGIIRPEIVGPMIRVEMGKPEFAPEKIPLLLPPKAGPRPNGQGRILEQEIEVEGRVFRMSAVSMGNPHCVITVDDAEAVPLEVVGPKLEHHPWFPRRTNVEFTQVLTRKEIKVRVWERGAGATLACGTGACAAAAAMMSLGRTERKVTVLLPGGEIEIEWPEENSSLFMTGPAEFVFDGMIELVRTGD